MGTTIEKRVADAILQRDKEIQIGGRIYKVTPPTPATLIMVSELAAELPVMDLSTTNVIGEILAKAKDAKVLGKIAATLILGAKKIREQEEKHWWSYGRKRDIDWLSRYLLEDCTIQELRDILTARLTDMQIADFFGTTASLSEARLTRATKEAGIQSGEQS